jgi:hypothetical protein
MAVEFTAEFLTALSVFIGTVVTAFITLRKEFQKVNAKADETHELVNSQMTRVIGVMETGRDDAIAQRDIAQGETRDLRGKDNR